MTVLRNVAAALAALLVMAFLAHVGAPVLVEHLPGQDAVSAVLGLASIGVPMLYKMLDGAMALLGLGRRTTPASSRWVSLLAGATALALIAGAFIFVTSFALHQAVNVARGAPAAEGFLGMTPEHFDWAKLGVVMFAALMVGSWTGRRHGLVPAVVAGFAVLGWLEILAIEVLSKTRDMAAVHDALRSLATAPSLDALLATTLPVLAGLLVLGFLGAWLGAGNRRRNSVRDAKPLHLGG